MEHSHVMIKDFSIIMINDEDESHLCPVAQEEEKVVQHLGLYQGRRTIQALVIATRSKGQIDSIAERLEKPAKYLLPLLWCGCYIRDQDEATPPFIPVDLSEYSGCIKLVRENDLTERYQRGKRRKQRETDMTQAKSLWKRAFGGGACRLKGINPGIAGRIDALALDKLRGDEVAGR